MNSVLHLIDVIALAFLASCETSQDKRLGSHPDDGLSVSVRLSNEFASSTGLSQYVARENPLLIVVAPDSINENDAFWCVPQQVKRLFAGKFNIEQGSVTGNQRRQKVFLFETRSDCYESLGFIEKICKIDSSPWKSYLLRCGQVYVKRSGLCVGISPGRRDLFFCKCAVFLLLSSFLDQESGSGNGIGQPRGHDYLMCSIGDWVSIQLFGLSSGDFFGSSGNGRSEILSSTTLKRDSLDCISGKSPRSLFNKMQDVFSKPRNFISRHDRYLGFTFIDYCVSRSPVAFSKFLDFIRQGHDFPHALEFAYKLDVDEFFPGLSTWVDISYK